MNIYIGAYQNFTHFGQYQIINFNGGIDLQKGNGEKWGFGGRSRPRFRIRKSKCVTMGVIKVDLFTHTLVLV
jgi:hypothetical protein